jgi:hypothetical protein
MEILTMRLSTAAFVACALLAAAFIASLADPQVAERSFAVAGAIWAQAMADGAGQPPVDDRENAARLVAATPR